MKPKLRFMEFNSDWNNTTLRNIAIINPKNENLPDKFIYIDLESVNKGILSQEKIISKTEAPSRAQRTIKKNDILFQTVRPYQQNNYFVKEIKDLPYVASTGYALIRTDENAYFIYSILHKKDFLDKVIDRCTGTSFPAISSNDLADININIPNIKEQTKISNFLSLLDRKIELQSKKIEDLKLFKKGLFAKIDFDFAKVYKLSDFLSEVSEKSTIVNQYEILSSTANGLFLQSEYFNKQAASENNIGYKILRKGQLVLSPQNLWMGNININDKYEIGIVSPSYKIFNIDTKIINQNILANWIKSPRALYDYMISSEQGASVVRRNLNIDLFNEITIKLPNIDVQNKLGKQISNLNKKIDLENDKLNKLLELKKGLMQNMFV